MHTREVIYYAELVEVNFFDFVRYRSGLKFLFLATILERSNVFHIGSFYSPTILNLRSIVLPY